MLTQLACGFSPKFIKAEPRDNVQPSAGRERLPGEVFCISSDSDDDGAVKPPAAVNCYKNAVKESVKAPCVIGVEGTGDKQQPAAGECEVSPYQVLEMPHVLQPAEPPVAHDAGSRCGGGGGRVVSLPRVIEGDSQVRASGDDCHDCGSRCDDIGFDGGSEEMEEAKNEMECGNKGEECRGYFARASGAASGSGEEGIFASISNGRSSCSGGDCDYDDDDCDDCEDNGDHDRIHACSHGNDGRVDIDIDDALDDVAPTSQGAAADTVTDTTLACQAAANAITETTRACQPAVDTITDAFASVAAAAAACAAVGAITATTNIADDALSRRAFFESFSAFMRSSPCDAFKTSQGLRCARAASPGFLA
jgi:hypothetical protein